jgi:alpha-beta hydrolase superfamily lysophospholipase
MKITFDYKKFKGIPIIECKNDTNEEKKLLFILHGYMSNKESVANYCLKLAKMNYHVITIDAKKHGERIEEPFITGSDAETDSEFLDIVLNTSQDLKMIYENYYKKEYSELNLMGISMGGILSFYTATLIKEVNLIVPIIGTPSFYEFIKYKITSDKMPININESDIEKLKYIEALNHIEKFTNKNIFILNAKEDNVVPEKWSKEFYNNIINHHNYKNLNTKIKFKSYDCGHTVNYEMEKDILDFFLNNI